MKWTLFVAIFLFTILYVPSYKTPKYKVGDCFMYQYRDIVGKITKVRTFRYEYNPARPPLKVKIISKIKYLDDNTVKIGCPK